MGQAAARLGDNEEIMCAYCKEYYPYDEILHHAIREHQSLELPEDYSLEKLLERWKVMGF